MPVKIVDLRNMAGRLYRKILNVVFPQKCPVCGEILTGSDRCENNPYICRYCYGKLRFITSESCLKCAKPLRDETQPFCSECARGERYFDRGFALLEHDTAAKHMIYGFKFRCELDNINFPALEIALRYGKDILYLGIEACIPVPLHKSRLRERGYNQALLLAQGISKYMLAIYADAPVCDPDFLVRCRKTRPQRELDHRYRRKNVEDAFALAEDAYGKYRILCLVDDIFTTGSTVSSCAKTLKKAGCGRVYFVTVSTVGEGSWPEEMRK